MNLVTADVHTLAARIAAEATDDRIDDTTFRRRAKRTAAQVLKILEAAGPQRGARRDAPSATPRYVFVAVPNGIGGTSCISIASPVFDMLASRLGGARSVTALARQVAAGHKPATGVSRSAYVLKRLEQRATRRAQTASQAPSSNRGGVTPKRRNP